METPKILVEMRFTLSETSIKYFVEMLIILIETVKNNY